MSIRNNYAADPALAQLLASLETGKKSGGNIRTQTREKPTIQNPADTPDRRKTEPKFTYIPISIVKPKISYGIKPDHKINVTSKTVVKDLFDDEEQDRIDALQRTIDIYSGADFNEDLTSGKKPGAISIDPALLEAQKVSEKKPAAISIDPALLEAQKIIDKYQKTGMIDPGLLEAQQQYERSNENNELGINTDFLVAKALSQVGIHEELIVDEHGEPILDSNGKLQGNNNNIYGEWYGQNGAFWCAQFVDWCVNNCGISPDLVPNKRNVNDEGINCASTGAYKRWYEKNGRYQKNDKKTPPHVGDIVILNNSEHIGIVVAYDEASNTVYTVEGNSGQYVSLNDYRLDDPHVVGFCLNGSTSYGTIPDASTIGVGKTTT